MVEGGPTKKVVLGRASLLRKHERSMSNHFPLSYAPYAHEMITLGCTYVFTFFVV